MLEGNWALEAGDADAGNIDHPDGATGTIGRRPRRFEVWEVLRATLKTDARNTASRIAIERLGAKAEGVRRAHAPTDGLPPRGAGIHGGQTPAEA